MYLIINNSRYTVSRRIKTDDTIRYLTVTPAPDVITGKIRMYTNEDVLMSEDDAEDYLRRIYTGTLLTLTNEPEPQPQPEPGPQPPTGMERLEAQVMYTAMMTDTLIEEEVPDVEGTNSEIL